MYPLLVIVGLSLIVFATTSAATLTAKQFVEKLLPIARYIQSRYGIKPEFTITQAALESNYGNSALTRLGMNLFGMTVGSWTGAVVEAATKEYVNGQWVTMTRKFRRYGSWTESAVGWAENLKNHLPKVYAEAVSGTVQSWARQNYMSGYATNPNYDDDLIARYNSIKIYL